jgi:3-oxoacyl-[acyl-carrier-protein] synthase II
MEGMRFVITGLGVVSPIGNGRDAFWNALISGCNGIDEIRGFDTTAYRTHRGGEVKSLEPSRYFRSERIPSLARGALFAIAATRMAMEDAELDAGCMELAEVGVCCGTTMGESQLLESMNSTLLSGQWEDLDPELASHYTAESMPANVAREFGFGGPISMVTTACSAGNYAIGQACDLLRSGRAKIVIAGGSDPFSRIAFAGFNSMLAVAPEVCRPFDLHRKGMFVSEGCAMLVLEPLAYAVRRGARIYAEVAGCGLSNDAHHMTSPHPQGRGAIAAMTNALREAGLAPEEIDYISAHGTGTPANDRIETAAIKNVFGDAAQRIPVSSIKSMLGHTMGAASAIEAATCALVIDRGIIPPTINYNSPDPACDLDYVPNVAREATVRTALSNAFAFGGNCSALILKRCEV